MMKFIYIILFASIAVFSFGQQSLPEKAPTPNAASLGLYGEIPVSYYTGNPGISIPLYEITVRGVTLPVKLDYDASGVQMSVLPSWTGYNWILSAGGAITRRINGFADEYIHPKHNYFHRYFDCYSLLPTLSNQDLADSISDIDSYDFEPDVFYFNFMGKNGKFFLGNDGQWKVSSDHDIDVVFNIQDSGNYLSPFIGTFPYQFTSNPNQPKTIAGFSLRDTDGVTYEFGYNKKAIEYTIDFLHMGDQEDEESWLATSWNLTKVTDRLGNVLFELTYERGPFFAQPFRCYEHFSYQEQGHDMNPYPYSNDYPETNFDFPYILQLDAPVYLSRIEASNGVRLTFWHDNNPQSMEDLYANPSGVLTSGRYDWYNTIKPLVSKYFTYPFIYLQSSGYSAYHANGADYTDQTDLFSKMKLQKLYQIGISEPVEHGAWNLVRFEYDTSSRMHLTKIKKCIYTGASTEIHAAYSFFYDDFEKLPLSCLTGHDHWGYYNGGYISERQGDALSFSQQKAPNASKMKYGTLRKIVYPTGGASILEYEPNDYSSVLSVDRQTMQNEVGFGGGVRVKSITEYDDSSCVVMLKRRQFSYTDPETGLSSGQLFAQPTYGWDNWIARDDNSITVTVSTIRSASIVPLSNSYGPAVGYSYVTEAFEDGGRILYHYYNLSDGPMDVLDASLPFNSNVPSPYDKFTERGFKRGKLRSMTFKDSQGVKTASSTFQYRTTGMTDNWIEASSISCRNGHASATTYSYKGRKYNIYYQRCDLLSRIDSMFYSDGTCSHTVKSFSYGDYSIPITEPYYHLSNARLLKQFMTTRGNHVYSESYCYPNDSGYTYLAGLAEQFFYLPVLSTEAYYDNTLIDKREYHYKSSMINGTSQKIPDYLTSHKHDSTEVLIDYSSYTSTGQLSRYTEINKPTVSLSWAYNDSYIYCMSKGINTFAPTFTQTDNTKLFKQSSLLPIIKRLSNNQDIGYFIGYTYNDHQNISSETNERGITTFYDYNNRRQLIGIRGNDSLSMRMFEYNFKNK